MARRQDTKNGPATPGAEVVLGAEAREPTVSIQAARSGDMTASVRREDGTEAFLHSRYDPAAEGARQVAEVRVGPIDTVVLLGMGLGYCVEALAGRLGPGNHLIVVEKEPALFEAAAARPSFKKVLSRPRTYFFVGTQADRLYDFLASHISVFLAAGFRLVRHPASLAAFPSYYGSFLKRIEDFVRTGGVTLRTAMYLSRISFANRMRNLEAYLQSPGIAPVRNRFAGRPGVVISAGPSLARNMHLLERVKGRAPLVAVSTAVKALLAKGIVPDFAVIIDYGTLSRRYFEDVPHAEKIPLVCDLKANAEAVGVYRGPKLFCDDLLVNTMLGDFGPPKGQIPSGSTVAHAAFHFVCYLGCDPVIFVGQDLAYTEGELHVPGTAVYQQSLAEFNRFYSPAMKELEYALTTRPRLREVPAWSGEGTVRTCDIFSTYLEEFEQFFKRAGRLIVDATEGGAAKRYTERMTLAEAIERFMPEELPPETFTVPSVPPDEAARRLSKARARLTELLDESKQLAGLYDRAIELIRKVLKENRRGRAADRIVLKVLKIKEELKRYGVLYLVASHLAQSDLFLRMRRDRELDMTAPSGVERQRKQAERDLEYLLGLRNALAFFQAEVKQSGLLRQGAELTEEAPLCGEV